MIARGFKQLSLVVRVYWALNEVVFSSFKTSSREPLSEARGHEGSNTTSFLVASEAECRLDALYHIFAFHRLLSFAWKETLSTIDASRETGIFEYGDI